MCQQIEVSNNNEGKPLETFFHVLEFKLCLFSLFKTLGKIKETEKC